MIPVPAVVVPGYRVLLVEPNSKSVLLRGMGASGTSVDVRTSGTGGIEVVVVTVVAILSRPGYAQRAWVYGGGMASRSEDGWTEHGGGRQAKRHLVTGDRRYYYWQSVPPPSLPPRPSAHTVGGGRRCRAAAPELERRLSRKGNSRGSVD